MGTHMLNFLYKTLLIALISGSLTTMNLAAYAQEAAASSSATAQMSKSDSSGLTRDADGVLKKTETHKFEGTKEDGALQIITMLAVGVIGTKLLMYKKWTLDMSVVAAASAAYIAAEIINIMNLKNQLSDMDVQVTKRSDGKMDQAQIETIEKLKESYEKVKKSVKTRKTLQLGAAAIFAGAAGIAAYQRYFDELNFSSCEAGILQAQAELATCVIDQNALATAAATAGASYPFLKQAAECGACSTTLGTLATELVATKTKSEVPGPSLTKATIVVPKDGADETLTVTPCAGIVDNGIKSTKVVPACTTYINGKKLNQAYGAFAEVAGGSDTRKGFSLEKMLFVNAADQLPKRMSVDPSIASRSFLQKMMDTVFPRAEAGMMAMLGLGVGAAASFFLAKTTVSQTIDKYLFTPGGRIVAWGILAAAALLGAKASQGEIDKIDGHLARIDQMLKDMNTLKSGIKSNNVNEQQIKLAAFKANQQQDIPLTTNNNEKTDCLLASGGGSCTPLSDTIKAMPGFTNLPDSFKSIASQSAQLGDGLSGTNSISGSTLTSAASLANKHAAIAKLGNSIKNKINDKLSKAGKQKIDFDKEEKGLWNQLKAQTSKALQSKGMSGGAFLSGTGISPISTSAAIAATPAYKPKIAPAVAAVAPASSESKDKDFSLDFNESPGYASGAGGSDAKEPTFDIGSNDINTDSGESIFQVISNRYIKSGYPKLLDEIPVKK